MYDDQFSETTFDLMINKVFLMVITNFGLGSVTELNAVIWLSILNYNADHVKYA